MPCCNSNDVDLQRAFLQSENEQDHLRIGFLKLLIFCLFSKVI